MAAYTGAAMQVGGWRHPIVIDLSGLQIPSPRRPIRLGHDPMLGVGHTESISIEDGRLMARGVISRDTEAAREVVVSASRHFPWMASIGASVIEHEFLREGASAIVNGREISGPVNIVRRATLGEISFVDLGADGNTSALVTAHHTNQPTTGEPPMTTTAAATPAASNATTTAPTTTDTAVAAAAPAAALAPATAPIQTTTDDPVQRLRAASAAEVERIAAVRALAHDQPALMAKAIKDGWDAQRTELEVLRATRPTAPAVHVRDNELTAAVLEAACIQAGHVAGADKLCSAPALEAADRRFHGRISLQRLLLEAAWANGCNARGFKDDPRSVMHAAWGSSRAIAAAGPSTIDLPGILSNVANKFLLAGFGSAEAVWRNIARIGSVTDFKQITRYRLTGNMTYERVAPGGVLKHGSLGEEKFANQADTYGKLIAIDRRDLINDDLGVITAVPQELGRGAAQQLNDLFWTTFLDHAAFFRAENRNLVSGADSALTFDGLTKAELAFNQQVDGSGKPLGIAPAILLVPTALTAYGSALIRATEIRETTANTKYPVFNPHQGKFRLEMSRFLDNPLIPGGSAKAWYLLANPADIAAIEVVFLNGQEAPVIETADLDFATLGIQLRGYHDWGVAKQDPRAAGKAVGA